MTDCPCCSNLMLRHIRQNQVHWFCRQCWQKMPVYNLNQRLEQEIQERLRAKTEVKRLSLTV